MNVETLLAFFRGAWKIVTFFTGLFSGRRSEHQGDGAHDLTAGRQPVQPTATTEPPPPPLWFKYLNGRDDDPLLIPVGYDGTVTLPDAGRSGLRPAARDALDTLTEKARAEGIPIHLTEGWRPRRRQAYLYAQGRDLPGGIVTKVKPGESKHQLGLAFDICFLGRAPYDGRNLCRLGKIGREMGLRWGGVWDHPWDGTYESWEKMAHFKDGPHFEMRDA